MCARVHALCCATDGAEERSPDLHIYDYAGHNSPLQRPVNGRVIGQVEIENLRDGYMQQVFERMRVFWQWAVETLVDCSINATAIA